MQDLIAIVLESPTGVIIGWDKGARTVFGYTPEEAVGRPFRMLLADPSDTLDREVSATDVLFCTRARRRVKLSCRRSGVQDEHGKLVATSSVLTRASSQPDRAQLEALMQTLPGALLVYRPSEDGGACFSHAGPAAAALLGVSTEELQADAAPMLARIHADDRQNFDDTRTQAAGNGNAWRCEFRYEHAVLGERWLVCNALPSRDAGALVWSAIILDITLSKRIEADLASAKAQLSSALEAGDLGAWIFDSETGMVWGNRQQRELWETPPEAPEWYEHSTCLSQMHAEDREYAFEGMIQALAGQPMRNEFRIVRSDGSVRWIAGRGQLESGTPSGHARVAGVNMDITQQKLLAEKAIHSQKLEALGTLAGGIAHDFNNVLFAIMGNTDVALLESNDGRDPRPMLLEVRAATERAADLIRQILAFSRPEGQANEVIELSGVVRGALTIVRATTPSRISLALDLDNQASAVRADASRIGQIVINLCTNAVHAIGKRPGTVEISLRPVSLEGAGAAHLMHVPRGEYSVLSVTDDGCGMDRATQARIFDPFFTTRRPGEGTGLGLSIVNRIVQAFGAHLVLRSEPGQGSRFEVYFPAAGGQVGPMEAPAPQLVVGRGQQIMFVDDEPMLVRLGGNLLRALGYRAVAFARPAEALEAFERNPYAYAVVVTDLAMPALSGLELARRMLAIRADLPIVLMSGKLAPEDAAEAARLGIRETVLKPSNLATLGSVIARFC